MDGTILDRTLLEAEGYLELGMLDESVRTLAALPPSAQSRKEVLELRLALHMTAADWPTAVEIAACLVELEPSEPGWWVNFAYCVRRARSLAEAEAILLRAVELHPENVTIHYNLSCYACVTGRLELAKERVARARVLGTDVDQMAMQDNDLHAIRDWIDAQG